MKVWGMLRVRNEARWIARVVDAIVPICDRILVMDDQSTDETAAIAAEHGATVLPTPFTQRGFIDESSDKDWLLQQVWMAGAQIGDYCFMIDGDEALHQPDIPAVEDAMSRGLICCSMHIVYLWDREDQVRVDRWYKEFRRPSLFKLNSRSLTFRRTAFGGNLHCSSAPAQLLGCIIPIKARLLHFGYLHREDRIRKYEFYNRIDPANGLEDTYRHVCQGDIPEIPATAALLHAGPLQLAPFPS